MKKYNKVEVVKLALESNVICGSMVVNAGVNTTPISGSPSDHLEGGARAQDNGAHSSLGFDADLL